VRRRNLARRLSVGVTDQLLSSGSNFVATIVAARYLDADGFGYFALAMLSYTLTLGAVRALCGEALLVRPGDDFVHRRDRAGRATGAAVWVGVAASAIFAMASVLGDGEMARTFAVLALAAPGLVLQDTLRYVAFSRGEPKAALLSDAIWFIGMVVCFGAVIRWADPTAALMLAAFAIPGLVGGAVQAVRDRIVPRLGAELSWILTNRDLSFRYALDYLSAAGAAQLASYLLVAVAGAASLGAIRGAQTLFGPVNILYTGASIVLVPEGRIAVHRSRGALTRMAVAASIALAVVSAGLLTIYLALSPSQGQLILGSTWDAAVSLVVPVGLASLAGSAAAGPLAGLRSLGAASTILRIRLLTIPATVLLPVAGALIGDARGLAYGIAAASVVQAVWAWVGYRQAMRTYEPADPVEPDDAPRPS
jgi:O-antigen/teichoic acid export membrane protein